MPADPASWAGLWWGNVEPDGRTDLSVGCIIVDSGELACVLFDAAFPQISGAMHGSLYPSDTDGFAGTGTVYAAPGTLLADGLSTVTEFTIVGGGLSDRNRHLDLVVDSAGVTQDLSLGFDHYYYFTSPANAAWVTGLYTEFAIFGDPASLSIDDSGSLFTQANSGCAGSGQLDQVVSGYNAFAVGVNFAGCAGLSGTYAGLASLTDFQWVNGYDQLLIAVFNDDSFVAAVAVKY